MQVFLRFVFDNKLLRGAYSLFFTFSCNVIWSTFFYLSLPIHLLVTIWFYFFLEHATTKRFWMTVVWSKKYQQTVPFITLHYPHVIIIIIVKPFCSYKKLLTWYSTRFYDKIKLFLIIKIFLTIVRNFYFYSQLIIKRANIRNMLKDWVNFNITIHILYHHHHLSKKI